MAGAKWRNLKVYLPQLYATVIVCLVYMCVGVTMVYSAILIPRLKDDKCSIKVSDAEQLWIVNSINLVMPLLSIFTGLATDKFGRLWVLKFTMFPHVLGWATIALAQSGAALIVGRILTGIATVFQIGPCFVYISEISSPTIRGASLGMPVASFGLGSFLTYFSGYLASWRTVAWMSCAHGIVSTSLLYTLFSSPSWLVSKKYTNEAKKSIAWLNKYQTEDPAQLQAFAEQEVLKMKEEQDFFKSQNQETGLLRMICLPIVYKPLATLTMVLFFQQFAGIYVLLMNTVVFFEAIGTNVDPYLASNYFAIVRLLMTIASVWIMKMFGRRPLLIINFLGMAVSIAVSGLFSKWIADGVTEQTWVPLLLLILYTMFTSLVVSIPFCLAGELFPLVVRGTLSNAVLGLLFVFSFIVVSGYSYLLDMLGGIHHLQYFYALMSSIGALVTFLFVPETLNKKLSDLESFFWTRTLAIGKPSKRKVAQTVTQQCSDP